MTEYEAQARKFLRESGSSLKIEFVGVVQGFPHGQDDRPHNKYLCTLSRGEKKYKFPFYDSYYNYMNEERPTIYDVLSCLEAYEPYGDVWDFANEYGYEIKSRETYNDIKDIYEEVCGQCEALKNMYEPKWLEELNKIN